MNATPEQRPKIAEAIGEEGGRVYAQGKGYKPLLTREQKALSQGPDAVYRGPDGRTKVLEFKGGTSSLQYGYGEPQGTTRWAIRSAEATLKSTKATPAEKDAARQILEAARDKKLDVEVIRTSHALGEPRPPVREMVDPVMQSEADLARSILDSLR